MAFENVFGNIDFMAPTRARQAEASQFQQLLGNAIQGYQEKQRYDEQMDLKRAEIEAQKNELNIKRQAETALYKQNLGMPLDEADRAAIATMAQIAPPVYTTDRFGRVVSQPSGWGALVESQPLPSKPVGAGQDFNPEIARMRQQLNNTYGGGGQLPPRPDVQMLSVDDLQGFIPQNGVDPVDGVTPLGNANVPYNPPQAVVSDGGVSLDPNDYGVPIAGQDPFAVPDYVSESPLGQEEKLKAGIDIQKKTQEQKIQEAFDKEKEKRAIPTEAATKFAVTTAEQAANMQSKLPAIRAIKEELRSVTEETMRKAPSGKLQGFGAEAAAFFGVPTEKAIAAAEIETTLDMIFPNIKNLVREAGEGVFTDADARQIESINYSKDDPYLIKKQKSEKLFEIVTRAENRILEQTKEYVEKQPIDYREFFR